MSQNGHIYFKNLAASVSDHIRTLRIKGLKHTNADLKISVDILIHIKIIPWKIPTLDRKNSWVIHP